MVLGTHASDLGYPGVGTQTDGRLGPPLSTAAVVADKISAELVSVLGATAVPNLPSLCTRRSCRQAAGGTAFIEGPGTVMFGSTSSEGTDQRL